MPIDCVKPAPFELTETRLPAYLVTYDLSKETVRPKIVDAVRAYGTWAKLSESSYAIQTGQTPEAVFASFSPMLDANDQLYVITLRRPHAGFGPEQVNQWLEKHVPW